MNVMIRLMASYPRSEDTHFDADYWLTTHMPLMAANWPEVTRWEADLGADDGPNYGIAHMYFDSHDTMGAALGGPGAGTVLGDVANYTNVQPVLVINTVAATS